MARTSKGAATIGEVASSAGVSRATVSRVMNGRSTVAPDIAARVLAAAAELQYRPSNVARSLSLGRTNSVALMVPDIGNPTFHQILRGAMSAAAPHGYRVLVAESAENPTDEAEIALEARLRCDALILVAPRMGEAELLELLPRVQPLVVVNRRPASAVPTLWVDYADGVKALVAHLVALGHRNLVYVAGPAGSTSGAARVAALREAVASYSGLTVRTVPCGSTVADGYAIADQVHATRASAAVVFNDLVAFGLLARLNEEGIAVPDDISITGFDDIELARYATPSLTTAAVPLVELGERAWHRLHDVIAEPEDVDAHRTEDRFTPTVHVRASTGPVPPGHRSTSRPGTTSSAVPASDRSGAPTWTTGPDAAELRHGASTLAIYRGGAPLPAGHSPRPYLHPVRTLGGAVLTQTSPSDHRHHYGLSLAVADVNGTSFWGGRTFVEGDGPTLLPNHGRQISSGPRTGSAPGALQEDVEWLDAHGDHLLSERRTLSARVDGGDSWTLRWRSVLTADASPLTFASPATNGRPGAGYGGLFWRLPPSDETRVRTADADDEAGAHGSRSPWITVEQRHGEDWATLLLVQPDEPLPWFVRIAEYAGLGPALAWDSRRHLGHGESLEVRLACVAVDGRLDAGAAASLAARVLAGTTGQDDA